MLAVSDHLLQAVPGVSVLLVTGSPMVQEFRMRPGLDKLMQLRSELIVAAAREFDPDVVLIDKKPDGVKHELPPTLEHLRSSRPDCKLALVLRDILDAQSRRTPAPPAAETLALRAQLLGDGASTWRRGHRSTSRRGVTTTAARS